METDFDLKDYSLELEYEERQRDLQELEEWEKSLHPLARVSQPDNWSSVS